MSDNQRRRFLAATGGLTCAAYLAGSRLPGMPDFLMGLLLGLSVACSALGLIPEERLAKLRKWKRRG